MDIKKIKKLREEQVLIEQQLIAQIPAKVDKAFKDGESDLEDYFTNIIKEFSAAFVVNVGRDGRSVLFTSDLGENYRMVLNIDLISAKSYKALIDVVLAKVEAIGFTSKNKDIAEFSLD